jgi:hypothetical protein
VPLSLTLTEETIRLYQRYQVEVVERFNLCPWAKSARASGNAVPMVIEFGSRPLLAALDEAARLEADIVLLILPDYQGSRLDLENVVAQLIREDGLRCDLSSPIFAMAAFHPEASAQTAHALDLVPYLRSTPDPTVQLVRVSALERARKNEPAGTQFVDPTQLDFVALLEQIRAATKRDSTSNNADDQSLRQRIAQANLHTWQLEGPLLQEAVSSILADRHRTHARLGLAPSPWEVSRANRSGMNGYPP